MIDYYVNTDTGNNSWNGTSATYVSGTTGPKATLNGALALFSTLIESVTIHCKGATADASEVRCDLETTDVNNQLYIMVDVADRHAGVWDDTKYHLTGAANFGANYCTVVGLQLRDTNSEGTLVRTVGISGVEAGGSTILLDSCIIAPDYTGNTAAANCVGLYVADTDAVVTVRNTLIYGVVNNAGGGNLGQGVQLVSGTLTLENCTIVGNGGKGIYRAGGTLTLKNTYVGGNGDADVQVTDVTFVTSACEDDLTATGLTKLVAFNTDTFASVTPGHADYLKVANNSSLYDAGTDLSATFTKDIAGVTRSSWDIGAFEWVSGAPAYTGGWVIVTG